MEVMRPNSWVHCDREFSAREVADICATVAWLPGLARSKLAATRCEPLGWVTLTGTAKTGACLEFLQRLQAAGLLVLPAQRALRGSRSTSRSPAQPRVVAEPMVEPGPGRVRCRPWPQSAWKRPADAGWPALAGPITARHGKSGLSHSAATVETGCAP